MALLLVGGERGASAVREAGTPPEETEAEAFAELVAPAAVRPAPPAPALQRSQEAAERRVVAAASSEERPPAGAAETPERAVHGVVLDAFGAPVRDVVVELTGAQPLDLVSQRVNIDPNPVLEGNASANFARSSGAPRPGTGVAGNPNPAAPPPHSGWRGHVGLGSGPGGPSPGGVVVFGESGGGRPSGFGLVRYSLTRASDERGEFDFGRVQLQDESRLRFAADRFVGSAPSQAVLPDDLRQVLQLPPRPRTSLVVSLVSDEGAPTPIPEWATTDQRSLAEGVARGYAETDPRDVTLRAGHVLVHGLAPGEVDLWVGARGYPPRHATLTVLPAPEATAVELRLEGPVADAAGTLAAELAFDTSNGFGDRRSDGFFGHTIDGFGNGALRGATLELVLEGVSYMARNDSVQLEFQGAAATPRWAWGALISELPGGAGWSHGMRRRIVLDLARLPSPDGPIDLLPALEDGYLDVYVQDDTAVHALVLRPVR